MKTLLLITETFPYGTNENSFIETEFEQLRKSFHVMVLPLLPKESEKLQAGYQDVEIVHWAGKKPRGKSLEAIQRKAVRDEIKEIVKTVHPNQRRDCIKAAIGYANRALLLRDLFRSIATEKKPDIIYSYWCTYATLGAIWLKEEMPEIRVISRFHGYDVYRERTPWEHQLFRTEIAKHIDECYFACSHASRYFAGQWGKSGKIAYLGTKEHPQVSANPHRFVLISCSDMIELKRINLIIEALSRVNQTYRIEWVHFGDGEERVKLEQMADDLLNKRENITWRFMGYMENAEMLDYYLQIKPSLFITTSRTEGGVPVSIQEAFSMGIPCIGTNVGGIPDAIEDGVNGFLLSENPEPNEISKAIERYYDLDEEEKKKFRAAAHLRWQERFNAAENAGLFCEHLKSLIHES